MAWRVQLKNLIFRVILLIHNINYKLRYSYIFSTARLQYLQKVWQEEAMDYKHEMTTGKETHLKAIGKKPINNSRALKLMKFYLIRCAGYHSLAFF
jgi:hypothetical protein